MGGCEKALRQQLSIDPAARQPVQLQGMEAMSSGDCKSVEFLPTVDGRPHMHTSQPRPSLEASEQYDSRIDPHQPGTGAARWGCDQKSNRGRRTPMVYGGSITTDLGSTNSCRVERHARGAIY